MTRTTNLATEATEMIQDADFREFWPIETRKALVRAAQTEGEFPPYAVRTTLHALRTARGIESKMNRDIAVGEASLSQAQRRVLAK